MAGVAYGQRWAGGWVAVFSCCVLGVRYMFLFATRLRLFRDIVRVWEKGVGLACTCVCLGGLGFVRVWGACGVCVGGPTWMSVF